MTPWRAPPRAGYRTRSILAAPVRNGGGKIVAVLQALNREGGPFDEQDEQLLGIFTSQAGVALQNALLFHRSQRASARVHSVLELVRNLQNDLNVNSLMFTITQVSCAAQLRCAPLHPPHRGLREQRAHALVDADRCTLFLVDHQSQELTSLQVRAAPPTPRPGRPTRVARRARSTSASRWRKASLVRLRRRASCST